jgi:hypothetical protein
MLSSSFSTQTKYSQYVREFQMVARHGSVEVDQTISIRRDAAQCARDCSIFDHRRSHGHFAVGRSAGLSTAWLTRISEITQYGYGYL